MTRLPRQNTERALRVLERRDQAGPGLKREGDKYTLNHGDQLIRTLPDGRVIIDVPRLRAEVAKESVTIVIDKNGAVALGPRSVDAPIKWNTRTGAHGLDFQDNLELVVATKKLRVKQAVDPGNCPAGSLAAIAAHVDLLRDAFVASGVMV